MRKYIEKNKNIFICTFIFSLVCFGFLLTHHTINIDEETWVLADKQSLLWLLQSRFGLELFNLIFTDTGRFVPFLWDFLAILFWNLSGIVLSYVILGSDEQESKISLFFFNAYYSSLPFVIGEMFAFSMMDFQVGVAMFCVAIAFWRTVCYVRNGEKREVAAIMLLLIFAFAVYQALICVYVTAVVGYALVHYLKKEKIKDLVVKSAIFCVAATAIYYIICELILKVTGTADYLEDNYVGWFGEDGPVKAAFLAFANIVRVSFGIKIQDEIIYGGVVICVITVIYIVYAICQFAKEKDWKRRGGILFYTVALVAASFVLYLALATYKTHGRHLLALPLAGGIELWLVLNAIKNKKIKNIMIVVLSFLLYLNARYMNMMYYYQSIVYEHDQVLANEVMYDIMREGMDYHSKPVVFIGKKEMDDIAIEETGTIGGSMFEWDEGNNYRMRDFMETEGYLLLDPTESQLKEAVTASDGMAEWPKEGSIKETENAIVVYFSEPVDEWYAVNNVNE